MGWTSVRLQSPGERRVARRRRCTAIGQAPLMTEVLVQGHTKGRQPLHPSFIPENVSNEYAMQN